MLPGRGYERVAGETLEPVGAGLGLAAAYVTQPDA